MFTQMRFNLKFLGSILFALVFLMGGVLTVKSAQAATVAEQVDQYTVNDGTNFIRSSAPQSLSTSGGTVSQITNLDGSVTVNASSATGYADSGFYTKSMEIGDLKSISVIGSGPYGVNIWLDTNTGNDVDTNGNFFTWINQSNTTWGGYDEDESLLGPSSNGALTINDTSLFDGSINGVYGSYTLAELKQAYPFDTNIAFWVGTTIMGGGTHSATIAAFDVVTVAPIIHTQEDFAAFDGVAIGTDSYTVSKDITATYMGNNTIKLTGYAPIVTPWFNQEATIYNYVTIGIKLPTGFTGTTVCQTGVMDANGNYDMASDCPGIGSTPLATTGAANGYLDFSFGANKSYVKDGLVKLEVIWTANSAPEYFTIDVNGLQLGPDAIPPTIVSSTINTVTKTIVYTLSEPIKFVSQANPLTITQNPTGLVKIYTASSYASHTPGQPEPDPFGGTNTATLIGNILTVNYTDTLPTDSYLVDTWGYTVTDLAGNPLSESIAGIFTAEAPAPVVDTTKPVITLTGANPQTIELGAGYTELGATTDDGSAIVINATAFVNAVGSYTITYNSTDASGNTAVTVNRTVNVVKTNHGSSGGSRPATPAVPAKKTTPPADCLAGQLFSVITGRNCNAATPATPGQVLGAEKFNFTLFVKNGSNGSEIIELQNFLNTLGDTLVVDGKFGPKTKTAVIKFQLANGLKGDGVVGPITRAVLNK